MGCWGDEHVLPLLQGWLQPASLPSRPFPPHLQLTRLPFTSV